MKDNLKFSLDAYWYSTLCEQVHLQNSGMSTKLYGQKWRGLEWNEWSEILHTPSVAILRKIVEQYSQAPSSDPSSNPEKIQLIERAMQVLDSQTPEVNNEQIKQIFTNDTIPAPTAYQEPHTTPKNPPIPPPASKSLKPNPGSEMISPWSIITSYLKSMHLQRICQMIAIFLREEYHQSSCLEMGHEPYLPISHVAGGLTVSTTPELNSCLNVGAPKIAFLQVEIPSKLNERQLYRFREKGQPVPYRGRGPVWRKNSCAVDCCVVAARLLNLGITTADRASQTREDWLKTLTPLEEHFLRIVGMPWETISNSTCIEVRDEFYKSLLLVMNSPTMTKQFQIGSFFSATAIWRVCTSSMRQFAFSDCRHSECTACNNTLPRGAPRPNVNQDILLDSLTDDMKGAGERHEWSLLINNYFGNRLKKCNKCGQNTRMERRRVYGSLPPRLVVSPSPEYRSGAIGTDSHHMTIKYEDSNGNPQEAIYRWLGGIFRARMHFRLYWIDEKNGEHNHQMMIYDGQLLEGSIIGSIKPREPKQKVPGHWAKETDMLFYERIDLLNPEKLHSTAELIKSSIDAIVGRLGEAQQLGQTTKAKTPDGASKQHDGEKRKSDEMLGESKQMSIEKKFKE